MVNIALPTQELQARVQVQVQAQAQGMTMATPGTEASPPGPGMVQLQGSD